MHLFYRLALAGLSLLSLACTSNSRQEKRPNLSADSLAGRYIGTLPCADCAGIAYQLVLSRTGSYVETSQYLGKQADSVVQQGKWLVENDSTVVLEKKVPGHSRYRVQGNELILLDLQGKPVAGHLADRYRLRRVPEGGLQDNLAGNQQGESDFMATGNEPFWALKIDFNHRILFKPMNGDSVMVPVPLPERDDQSGKVVYKATSGSSKVAVTIQAKACTNSMSGKLSDFTVEVQTNNKTYLGCGEFLFNAWALHDIWAVESLNGNPIKPDSTRRQPTLEIHVLEQQVLGHTGCNNLRGRVIIGRNQIRFSNVATTRKFCPGSPEQPFLQALEGANQYRLAGLKLVLLQNGKEVMQLKKVD